jgi:hypothetical protein
LIGQQIELNLTWRQRELISCEWILWFVAAASVVAFVAAIVGHSFAAPWVLGCAGRRVVGTRNGPV